MSYALRSKLALLWKIRTYVCFEKMLHIALALWPFGSVMLRYIHYIIWLALELIFRQPTWLCDGHLLRLFYVPARA